MVCEHKRLHISFPILLSLQFLSSSPASFHSFFYSHHENSTLFDLSSVAGQHSTIEMVKLTLYGCPDNGPPTVPDNASDCCHGIEPDGGPDGGH